MIRYSLLFFFFLVSFFAVAQNKDYEKGLKAFDNKEYEKSFRLLKQFADPLTEKLPTEKKKICVPLYIPFQNRFLSGMGLLRCTSIRNAIEVIIPSWSLVFINRKMADGRN
ncbi:hypothetical protein A3860_37680 [Niastella vici]|uniref:Uncharacterized protein n=1 Tax=Niastella vici TaxID=1703345 RepID=A0A1V9FMG0_9BACT|nr:hypothetical protein A3860_37680 [Niastella vici]